MLASIAQNHNHKSNKIEELKKTSTPHEAYERLLGYAQTGYHSISASDKTLFFKYFGLFDRESTPEKFMLRVRISGGALSVAQARTLATIAYEFGKDYIDITTRAQVELRYLDIATIPTIFERLERVGLTSFQTGIDNNRNIVTDPLDGYGKDNKIVCYPLIKEMEEVFLNNDEWIGTLPRKFNTAISGSTTNRCNIFGHDCSFVLARYDDMVGFHLYLGGKVGVQARFTGLFVTPAHVKNVFETLLTLFKTYGFRDNRNKNRLHFLLEEVGLETIVAYLKESCTVYEGGETWLTHENDDAMQESIPLVNDYALMANVRAGITSGTALHEACEVATQYGNGLLRFSVDQNLYILGIKEPHKARQHPFFLRHHIRDSFAFAQLISCHGSHHCPFGVIEGKSDALAMSEKLHHAFPHFQGNVRLYWSGCPKGCGLHGIGDIGFEGCKVKKEGQMLTGVHIVMGGKVSFEAKEAEVLFKSMPLDDAFALVEQLLRMYQDYRNDDESFEAFHHRFFTPSDYEELQEFLMIQAQRHVQGLPLQSWRED